MKTMTSKDTRTGYVTAATFTQQWNSIDYASVIFILKMLQETQYNLVDTKESNKFCVID